MEQSRPDYDSHQNHKQQWVTFMGSLVERCDCRREYLQHPLLPVAVYKETKWIFIRTELSPSQHLHFLIWSLGKVNYLLWCNKSTRGKKQTRKPNIWSITPSPKGYLWRQGRPPGRARREPGLSSIEAVWEARGCSSTDAPSLELSRSPPCSEYSLEEAWRTAVSRNFHTYFLTSFVLKTASH